jgi:hypothetical protein
MKTAYVLYVSSCSGGFLRQHLRCIKVGSSQHVRNCMCRYSSSRLCWYGSHQPEGARDKRQIIQYTYSSGHQRRVTTVVGMGFVTNGHKMAPVRHGFGQLGRYRHNVSCYSMGCRGSIRHAAWTSVPRRITRSVMRRMSHPFCIPLRITDTSTVRLHTGTPSHGRHCTVC